MGFRGIGEIAAEMAAKALDKRLFPLKQNENIAKMKRPGTVHPTPPGPDLNAVERGQAS